ncbi:ATP-grasp domain-containing protein [Vibrio cholerae]|uniref:ATP-grasp domain-containing protein n=1 Tax=Vibrio cholerae TaxID=666 RepID=UPI000E0ADD02|nr:ATP-grasp domain-containing protein [Vibrio cholerae]EGQ9836762.1 ATP-grasp domain-containing protein [Vibrio cholerae]EJL6470927.1 ATP-grasp domain-containing protein [Vibrio cholerae]EJL6717484.1 ATP-grasp domain-containing protein [Vibrio cholerae]EKF9635749.1 ATP-grasp domain-containing protein [Vibrio cholerae]
MSNILILGAGVYQVPLIKQVSMRGFNAIVVSPKGDYPGLEIADVWIDSDVRDYNSILSQIKDIDISGVITTGSDVSIFSLAIISNILSVTSLSIGAARNATDKILMKNKLIEGGVSTPSFFLVNNLIDIVNHTSGNLENFILKAPDLSGSRGVIRLSEFNLTSAFEECFSSSKSDYLILEEYITGIEFGAQAAVQNNQLVFFAPHEDLVYEEYGVSVPIAHSLPMINIDSQVQDKAKQILLDAISALGLNDCFINADFIVKDEEVYLIEVGARAGATCLPEICSLYYNSNFYDAIIDLSLGNDIRCYFDNPSSNYIWGELLISNENGIISSLPSLSIDDLPFLLKYSLDVKHGDRVRKFRVGPDRIGQFIAEFKDPQEAQANLDFIRSKLSIECKK